MNKEIRDRWAEELRSRSHEQGTGFMHYQKRDGSERFCALGVLCDMAEKEGVTPSQFFKNLGAWKYGERGFSFPPPEVVAWAGLDKDYGATGNVARMNDNGAPFASIADWIEKNL